MRSTTCRVATGSLVALLMTVSPLALSAAHAQTDPEDPNRPADGDAEASQDSPVPPSDEASSDENDSILVTAQRRTERAQDVPLSLQAFSGENLDNAVVDST